MEVEEKRGGERRRRREHEIVKKNAKYRTEGAETGERDTEMEEGGRGVAVV